MPLPPTPMAPATLTDDLMAQSAPQELPEASDPTNDFMIMLMQMLESKGIDMDAAMSGQVQLNDVLSPEEMNMIMQQIQLLPPDVRAMLEQALGQI
jgi:hypothetical protein